jgi:hypothetical protein
MVVLENCKLRVKNVYCCLYDGNKKNNSVASKFNAVTGNDAARE